ncbi:large ribosomal subunit protein eL14-like [Symsagittifera roscoffensis]|uniref:large ribosomal subunit protein eL14-like n=1 Tax=Symsagittifera roscoffensis TaxID=84072 RepID=UPI00307C5314
MSEALRERRERLKKKSAQAAVMNMFGGDGVKKEGESSDAPAPQMQPEEEMTIPVVEESAVQSAPGGSNLFSAANQIEDEADESEDEDKVKMSAEADSSDNKVFVEVGRVALIQQKRYKNKLAVIVNVVDQRRAICDIFHPHGKEVRLIARASIAFKTLRLTKLIVEGFQWSAHSKVVTDKYKECKIQEKFQATKFYEAWQKKIKRENMTDYDRFKCAYIKKKRTAIIRKKLAEINKSAKK